MYHLWKHIKRNPLLIKHTKKLAEIGTFLFAGFLFFRINSDVQLVTLA